MPSIYSKSTKELIEDFVHSFSPPPEKGFGLVQRKPLADGGHFTRKEILDWFQKSYPKIKQGTVNAHLIMLSTNALSRVHHNPDGADDLLFQIDRSTFRLYNKDSDPPPIYKHGAEDSTIDDIENDDEERHEKHEFAYEKDLKNFLASNMYVIRPSLRVYQDQDGDISGVEFPAGNRYVDILAVENNSDLVVIELKVSKGSDRAVGQLLYYMGWIQKNLAESDQNVKGMIIARTISDDLRTATSQVKDVELFEYQLSFSLKKIEK